jgi:hypothetical protein
VLLLPPENAGLFVRNGWSKQDIRDALWERTRRSVGWVKRGGWKVQWQRPRLEPVERGDEEVILAVAGSAQAEDLVIVTCGGPAGAWPYYLYGGGGLKLITRKIRESQTAKLIPSAIEEALAGQRAMLAADGYALTLTQDGNTIVATISARPEACADCLVPRTMMQTYFEKALGPAHPPIRLIYPGD